MLLRNSLKVESYFQQSLLRKYYSKNSFLLIMVKSELLILNLEQIVLVLYSRRETLIV